MNISPLSWMFREVPIFLARCEELNYTCIRMTAFASLWLHAMWIVMTYESTSVYYIYYTSLCWCRLHKHCADVAYTSIVLNKLSVTVFIFLYLGRFPVITNIFIEVPCCEACVILPRSVLVRVVHMCCVFIHALYANMFACH